MNDTTRPAHNDAPEMHFSAVTLSATQQRSHIDVQARMGLALSAAQIVLGRHGCVAVQYKQVLSKNMVGRFSSAMETCADTRVFRAGVRFSAIQEA
jgi:hypothetical protein